MKFSFQILSCGTTASFLAGAQNAHAHLGHVGDFAGHSHWVGVGATLAAGVLIWALGKEKKKDAEKPDDAGEAQEEVQQGEEQAA